MLMVTVFLPQSSNMVCFFLLGHCDCLVRSCRGCVGNLDFCLSCEAWSLRWLDSGSVLVSLWRCCALVSGVQPVTTLRALFWVDCNFWRLVSDMIGYQTVLAYSMTGKIIVLRWLGVSLFVCPRRWM